MKKIALLLAVAVIAFTGSAVYATCTGVCGDINGDGQVDIGDLTVFIYCYNIDPFDPVCLTYNWSCADFNGDGSVNLADRDILIDHLFISLDPLTCY